MPSDRVGARVLGRYVLHDEFASGGMAAVHFGRLVAEAGFTRTVAIKRLHAQHAKDPPFVAMLLDEARLAGRIRHPNVAPILDVVQTDGEVFLVMEYVHGESLASLSRATVKLGSPIPARLASSVILGVLHGLHAAHIATNEVGEPLNIVHRDVSPENVLVGTDGVPRVLDFGIALASGRSQVTREGGLKGKLGYMAPELLEGAKATPTSDVYSVGVVLWEALCGERLFTGEHEGQVLAKILKGPSAPPSAKAALPPGVDAVVMRSLARDPADRYRSADDFALALEAAIPPAPARDVATWVASVAGKSLSRRAAMLGAVETAKPSADRRPEAPGEWSTTELLGTIQLAPRSAETLTQVIGSASGPQLTEVLTPIGEVTDARALSRDASKHHARRTGAIVVGAIFAVMFVVMIAVLSANGAGARSASEDAPLPTASSAVASPSSPPSTPAPTASSEPSPAPTASAIATTPPADAEPRSTVKAPRVQHPPRSTPAKPSCDPPFTIDERGVHHYKPGCL